MLMICKMDGGIFEKKKRNLASSSSFSNRNNLKYVIAIMSISDLFVSVRAQRQPRNFYLKEESETYLENNLTFEPQCVLPSRDIYSSMSLF